MSLWRRHSNDESSSSSDELTIDSPKNDTEKIESIEFSSALSSRETDKALRRETKSPLFNFDAQLTTRLNRLKSIYHDSKVVQKVSSIFPHLPLVGNTHRCNR